MIINLRTTISVCFWRILPLALTRSQSPPWTMAMAAYIRIFLRFQVLSKWLDQKSFLTQVAGWKLLAGAQMSTLTRRCNETNPDQGKMSGQNCWIMHVIGSTALSNYVVHLQNVTMLIYSWMSDHVKDVQPHKKKDKKRASVSEPTAHQNLWLTFNFLGSLWEKLVPLKVNLLVHLLPYQVKLAMEFILVPHLDLRIERTCINIPYIPQCCPAVN